MILRQPISDSLAAADSVLLAGAGGGYDILGTVPLFADLVAAGKTVHLAGVSFSDLESLGAAPDPRHPHLHPIRPSSASRDAYCPEAWLAAWLEQRYGYTDPIWCLSKCGVRPLRAAYSRIAAAVEADAVVLVDGGVDVLMRGDETSIGTPAEDLCSLAAVAELPVATKLIACIGFGSELREGVRHAQVLERVAELSRLGAFLGALSLTSDTSAGSAYLAALAFVEANQAGQRGSHVHSVIRAALAGEFGDRGPEVWVSALSSLFWFFDLPAVAASHLFLRHLHETESIFDATAIIRACRRTHQPRPPTDIPL